MIPHFCGLLPAVADQLVAAFEEHEKRQHAKELEEAENARKIQEGSEGGLDGDRQFTLTKNNVNSILEQVFMKDPARMGTLKRAPTVKKAAIDPKNISLDDFSLHSVLGRGAFGKVLLSFRNANRTLTLSMQVMLVSEKVTGSYFAMKALKKEFIIKNDDVGR